MFETVLYLPNVKKSDSVCEANRLIPYGVDSPACTCFRMDQTPECAPKIFLNPSGVHLRVSCCHSSLLPRPSVPGNVLLKPWSIALVLQGFTWFLSVLLFFSFGWNSRKTLLIEKFKIIFMWDGQFGELFFRE